MPMNNSFSPNMIKIYMTCPKKFYFQYSEHLDIPKSTLPFEKGKKIHALANYYLQGIKIDRIETALDSEEFNTWQTLKENKFYNLDYYKSEFSLSVKLDNKYWIGGRIDAIVKNENDFYILDYKTGKIPQNPEYDPQTMIYLLCADEYLKNYNKLSFVYINLKEKNNYVIEFNDKFKAQYKEKLSEICDKIYYDTKFNKTHSNCEYCEYKKICTLN